MLNLGLIDYFSPMGINDLANRTSFDFLGFIYRFVEHYRNCFGSQGNDFDLPKEWIRGFIIFIKNHLNSGELLNSNVLNKIDFWSIFDKEDLNIIKKFPELEFVRNIIDEKLV